MIKITVNGAAGKMGSLLCKLIVTDNRLKLVGAVDSINNPNIDKNVGNGIKISDRLSNVITNTDVIIDFSFHSAVAELLDAAKGAGKALVICTTGHTPEEKVLIKKASAIVPILFSPNMSIGVNLLWKLTEIACGTLDDSYEINIREKHHVHKKDSPSGTAKKIIEIIRKFSREPKSVDAIREGEVVGEHTISFGNSGEKIELSHCAFDRAIFAKGAIEAAKWIVDKAPGLYDMQDVL